MSEQVVGIRRIVGFVRVRGYGMREVWVGGWGREGKLRWCDCPHPRLLGWEVGHAIFGEAEVEVITFGSKDRPVTVVAGMVG